MRGLAGFVVAALLCCNCASFPYSTASNKADADVLSKLPPGADVTWLNNTIVAIVLSGTTNASVPSELGLLQNLVQFSITSSTYAPGSRIPSQLGLLQNLETLVLQGASTTFATSTTQQAQAAMSGSLPSELGALTKLQTLKITNHNITGSIPTELGQLTSATSIDLSGNAISGAIPSEFALLTTLQVLDVHSNRLSGTIPSGLEAITADQGGILLLQCNYNMFTTGYCSSTATYVVTLQAATTSTAGTTNTIGMVLLQDGLASTTEITVADSSLLPIPLLPSSKFITHFSALALEDITTTKLWVSGGTDSAFLSSVSVVQDGTSLVEFVSSSNIVASPRGSDLPVSAIASVLRTSLATISQVENPFVTEANTNCYLDATATPTISAHVTKNVLFVQSSVHGGITNVIQGPSQFCTPLFSRFSFSGADACLVGTVFAWAWADLDACGALTQTQTSDGSAQFEIAVSIESVVITEGVFGTQNSLNISQSKSLVFVVPSSVNLATVIALTPTILDTPVCGNGVLEFGEQCDDGNIIDGDCCSSACVNETVCTTTDNQGGSISSTSSKTTFGTVGVGAVALVGGIIAVTLLATTVRLRAKGRAVVVAPPIQAPSAVPPAQILAASQSDFMLRSSRDARLHLHEVVFPRLDRTVIRVGTNGRFENLNVQLLPDAELPPSMAAGDTGPVADPVEFDLFARGMHSLGSRKAPYSHDSTVMGELYRAESEASSWRDVPDRKQQLTQVLQRSIMVDSESSNGSTADVDIDHVVDELIKPIIDDLSPPEMDSGSSSNSSDELEHGDNAIVACNFVAEQLRQTAQSMYSTTPAVPSTLDAAIRLGTAVHDSEQEVQGVTDLLSAALLMVQDEARKDAPQMLWSAIPARAEALHDLLLRSDELSPEETQARTQALRATMQGMVSSVPPPSASPQSRVVPLRSSSMSSADGGIEKFLGLLERSTATSKASLFDAPSSNDTEMFLKSLQQTAMDNEDPGVQDAFNNVLDMLEDALATPRTSRQSMRPRVPPFEAAS